MIWSVFTEERKQVLVSPSHHVMGIKRINQNPVSLALWRMWPSQKFNTNSHNTQSANILAPLTKEMFCCVKNGVLCKGYRYILSLDFQL